MPTITTWTDVAFAAVIGITVIAICYILNR